MRFWIVILAAYVCSAVSATPSTEVAIAAKESVTSDGSRMVLIPSGPFVMGSNLGAAEETPPHSVEIPTFYIDAEEVTVEQYARYIAATGAAAPADWAEGKPPAGRDKLPMTNLTWLDAMRYAAWAGKRLPTEAEWEKAARGTDGRLFPWGNVDDPARRNLDSEKLRPVGQFPTGASPFGCLDMSGNAWEWTADWFEGYPGTSARSPHFGQQYKVIRGGGGVYLYGVPNTGTCTQRARLVPYGAHDFVGFRCVKDLPGQSPPYDPIAVIAEAEKRLDTSLRPPRKLSFETEFDKLKESRRIPITIVGVPRQKGLVRTGFPLPEGMFCNPKMIQLLDSSRNPASLQVKILSQWPDGSIRWLLAEYDANAGETRTLEINNSEVTETNVSTTETIDPAKILASWFKPWPVTNIKVKPLPGPLCSVWEGDKDQVLFKETDLLMKVQTESGSEQWQSLQDENHRITPSANMLKDEQGGTLVDSDHKPTGFHYTLQTELMREGPQMRMCLTVTHAVARKQPYETPNPVVKVKDIRWVFRPAGEITAVRFGSESGVVDVPVDSEVVLDQPDELHYTIERPGQKPIEGTRSPGWLGVQANGRWTKFGLRHFWQNCPKQLFVSKDNFGVRLWAGKEPFEWEGGLAKTHEVVLEMSLDKPETMHLDPLRAVIPPAWVCGTKAAGALMPRTPESLESLPYWEARRQIDMQQFVNGMPFGFRDFGDGYMGGPYKGKNAYMDLEYDIPWNFLMQFLRTGDVWYLNQAEVMVRHQADIDTENAAGFQWKHSPQHTTTQAELGHVFIRGLLLHYLLTGEIRSLETAEKIGKWIAGQLERGEGLGNERQIGWSLYALSGLYEVTGNPEILEAATTACNRLIEGQSPTGKFKIRWDNRIAFFNGIAMNGMLTVQQLSGDNTLAEAIDRVANRTLGMYPEYACRTLNAFSWILGRKPDGRYLDAMERSWISSMEFLHDRDSVAEETHAWMFPAFAARYGLFPVFEEPPKAMPEVASWKAIRFVNPAAEMYLKVEWNVSAPILLIREGLAQGKITIDDLRGKSLVEKTFANDRRMFEADSLLLSGPGIYRLRCESRDAYAWQVQWDGRCKLTVVDPRHTQLASLLPRAYGCLRPGIKEVKIRFEVMGEGFHRAALYDSMGRIVSTVQKFVDFEDVGRYEVQLTAPVSGEPNVWSLELYKLKVLFAEGFMPYWSIDAQDIFIPERE
ncbi:MAG: SUMF1/EgtB/PvdO family nonheme iron enzyme [Phycisphaerae bacterium]|nr:SUMF1/EgtB/PvdO family nonheme iron enzyme [Phycisphaerae bacterium]